MAEQAKIILVGCGNMGFAMLSGWLESNVATADDVWVVEPSEELRQRVIELGVRAVAGGEELPTAITTDLLLFAVKPQAMDAVLPAYGDLVSRSNPAIASVAAGIPIRRFEAEFGNKCAIIRIMPNTPSAVGQGMMVICPNQHVGKIQLAFVEQLMEASGKTALLHDETLMDAVTAISGSGPAYLFHMVEALRDAGKALGLQDDLAHTLAMQTIVGAANYAAGAPHDVAQLREQVTSPNGTTAAALAVLMQPETGLGDLMARATTAARDRSIELGS